MKHTINTATVTVTKEKNLEETIFSLRFPTDLHDRAKTRAKSRGVSMAGYMRQLVIDDLEKASSAPAKTAS